MLAEVSFLVQGVPMKSTWKKYLLYSAYILIASGLLYGLSQLILAGYSASWTGFGERTLSNGDIVGEKTLWDWMDLLIIPFVLAIGAFFLNRSERAVERQIAEERRKEDRKLADERAELERGIAKDRQQEAALQAYIGRMSELLLEKKLRTTKQKEVREVARTLTISVIRGLDNSRKNIVLQFLYEANLIRTNSCIIGLKGVNFGGLYLQNTNLQKVDLCNVNFRGADMMDTDLSGAYLKSADLYHANLHYAYLEDANLEYAVLERADLGDACLRGANLQHVNLVKADLQFANLVNADLQFANLKKANLDFANMLHANLQNANLEEVNFHYVILQDVNMKGANVTEEQLAQAKSLKGATMPDGTIHE